MLTTMLRGNKKFIEKFLFEPKIATLWLAALTLIIALLTPLVADAAGADLDPTFNPNLNDTVFASVVQPDGKIILAGNFTNVGVNTRDRIARYNPDGTLDTTFSAEVNDDILAIALQPDGKILIGGQFTTISGTGRNRLARLNANGTVDSWNPNISSANTEVRTIIYEPDGQIFIGGTFTQVGGTGTQNRVARFLDNGTLDTTFNPNANGNVFAAAYNATNDKYYIAGAFTQVGGTTRNRLARLNANGSLDTTFGTATNGVSNQNVFALALQSDGKIIAGGNFTQVEGVSARNRIARFTTTGTFDSTFDISGGGFDNNVETLLITPDNKVLVGGAFTLYRGTGTRRIVRINTDGNRDATFDTTSSTRGVNDGAVETISLQSDGRIIIGGSFTDINGGTNNRNRAARLEGTYGTVQFGTTVYTGTEGTNATITATRTGGADGRITARIPITDVTTSVGADYPHPGDLDTAFNTGANPGTNNEVRALAFQPDGKIIVGGNYTTIRGQTQNGIARLNPDGSLDTTFNTGADPGTSDVVYAIALQPDGKIIIGGSFTTVRGVTQNNIARLNTDGSLDTTFNTGANPGTNGTSEVVWTVGLQPNGKIIVGGRFSQIRGVTQNNLARLNTDGSVDTTFNIGANIGTSGEVWAVGLQPDGRIVIGGLFGQARGVTQNNLARLNADGSLDTTFNTGGTVGTDSYVLTVVGQPDGKILIGGDFTQVRGTTKNYIARLNTDGTLDTTFNVGGTIGTDARVWAIGLQPDNKIIIGGSFTTARGVTQDRIARLNADGTLDTTFNTGGTVGTNFVVHTLGLQPDGKVVIGGIFTTARGVTQNRIARLYGDYFVSWAAGETGDKTISIPIIADGIIETQETATLGLQIASGLATVATPVTATLVIPAQLLNTPITLTSAPNSSYFGQSVTFTASVATTATGTITFREGATVWASVPVVGGVATYVTSTLSVGDHIVTATYNGDSNFGSVTSSNYTHTVRAGNYGQISLSATSYIAPEGTSAVITVSRTGGGDSAVVARIPITDVSTTAGADYPVPSELDTSFTPNLNSQGFGVGVQSDGKILILGNFTQINGTNRTRLARLNTDGSLDTSFTPTVNTNALEIAVQSDGKILIVGFFTQVNGTNRNFIARLNADGSLDTSFTPSVNDYMFGIAVQSDGKILIGGVFTQVNGINRTRLARLNTDGSLDTSFTPTANFDVNEIAVQSDGKILIGGNFTQVNGINRTRLARLNVDGSLDASFTPTANFDVIGVAVQPNDQIVIGGEFTQINGTNRTRLARLNVDGSLDAFFTPTTNLDVFGIAVQPNGIIIIVGEFTQVNGTPRNYLARLNGDYSVSWAEGETGSKTITIPITADGTPEPQETATLGLQISNGLATVSTPATATLIIPSQLLTTPITLTSAPNSSYFGQSVTFTASVATTATGTITFREGATVWATVPVAGGIATYVTSTLSIGDHIVTASYSGDATFQPATSGNYTHTVRAANYGQLAFSASNYIAPEGTSAVITVSRTGGGDSAVVARIPITDVSTTAGADYLTSGNLDTTFNTGPNPGVLSEVLAMAVQPDGKIIIGGNILTARGVTQNNIARLNVDGSLDTTFNTGSNIGTAGTVLALAIQPDGKIIIGGNFPAARGVTQSSIARLNADGSLDTTFNSGPNPGTDGVVNAIAVQPDGKIIIGGQFTTARGVTQNNIARLNADGSLDTTFNTGPNQGTSSNTTTWAVAVQPDGKIIIAGGFTAARGVIQNNIARLNVDGTLDTTFNTGPNPGTDGGPLAVAVQPNGKIIIAGGFNNARGVTQNNIARLNTDGSLDTTFNTGPNQGTNGLLLAITLQPDGKIVIGGFFTTARGVTQNYIARLNADGSLDTTFNTGPNPGTNNFVFAVALQPDGKTLIGGRFSTARSVTQNGIARLKGDYTVSWAEGETGSKTITIPITADGTPEPQETAALGLQISNGLATVSTPATATLIIPSQLLTTPVTLTSAPNSSYFGQSVTFTASVATTATGTITFREGASIWATATIASGVATYVTSTLSVGDHIVTATYNGDATFQLATSSNYTHTVRVGNYGQIAFSGTSYIAPEGTSAVITVSRTGGSDSAVVATIPITDVTTVVSVDYATSPVGANSLDATFTPSANDFVNGMAVQSDGKIIIGGFFTQINGTPRNYLTRLNPDGSLDSSFTSTANAEVTGIAVQADGKIILVGTFTQINGTPRQYLARLNSNGTVDASFTPTTDTNPFGVATQTDGKIILVGDFTQVNGTPRQNLARLNSDGTLDTSFTPTSDIGVNGVKVQADGKIVIGGGFGLINGTSRSRLARLNSDGSLDTSFTPSVNAGMPSTVVFDVAVQTDGKIVIGGEFSSVNGISRTRLARLNPDGSLDTSFNASANNRVVGIVIQADGRIVIGGSFTQISGTNRARLARLINDYTVSWAEGETGDKTITIPITADGTPELQETATLGLQVLSGLATVSTPATATLIIPSQFYSTTANVTSSPNPSALGQNATFTATVTNTVNAIVPSGVVTLTRNGSFWISGTLNVQGQFVFVTNTLAIGSYDIVATYGGGTSGGNGFTGSTSATYVHVVSNKTLVNLAISPVSASIPTGGNQQYLATGTYSDNSTQDVTSAVTWGSSNTGVATIASGVNGGRATGVAPGTTTITATLGSVTSNSATLTVTNAVLTSIVVSPSVATIPDGTTQQYQAFGTFTDGTQQNISASVTWSSSNLAVGTINATGLATAVDPGTTTIRATSGAISGTATLNVTDARIVSLAISPTNASIPNGTNLQYVATGTFSDGSTRNLTSSASWSSTNTGVATINATGRATGVSVGTTTIGASFGGVNASTGLTVTNAVLTSITVSPTTATIPEGTTQIFRAIATFSDGTNLELTGGDISWSSSNAGVATISAAGLATAVDPGTSTIQATSTSSPAISGTATLNVSAATLQSITVSPASASIARGSQLGYTATGNYSDGTNRNLTSAVTWTTGNGTIASIVPGGLLTANNVGSTTVRASLNGVTSADANITVTAALLQSILVTPTNSVIPVGGVQNYQAIGFYSDGTQQVQTGGSVNWSSNPAVATINASGQAIGVAEGTTTITATSSATPTISGTATLNVTNAQLLTITVTPANPTLNRGQTQQFTATGQYSDGSTRNITSLATWSSGNNTIVTINGAGLATAANVGSTNVTATFAGKSGNTNVTVVAASLSRIEVSPNNAVVPVGGTQSFTAVGYYSDGTTQTLTAGVTWSSSNTGVATINPTSGVANAVSVGTTIISATVGSVTGTAVMNVTNARVVSLTITPTTATIADGTSLQYRAIATFSDGTTQDVTSSATWNSSVPGVATIDANGLARGVVPGGSIISAAVSGVTSNNANLTVTNATLSSIAITPTNPTIAAGTTQQFRAIATFSDGTTQDVTANVTWASGTPGVATIDASGLATAVAVGSTTITATSTANPTISGTTTLNVTAAQLRSIAVTPAAATVVKGEKRAFVATGTFSDNSTQDITSLVTWTSGNNTVATILNADGYRGVATGEGVGSTTITATFGTISGTATITVNAAQTSVALEANPPGGASLGQNVVFTATVSAVAPGSGIPQPGNIEFYDGATLLGTVAVNANGVATYNTSALPGGVRTIGAKFVSGTPNYADSSLTTISYTIGQSSSSIVFATTPNPSVYGSPVSLVATVTVGAGTATGVVSFTIGTQLLGTVTLDANGVATYTTSTFAAGTYNLVATYLGNASYAGVSSGIHVHVVEKAPTTTTLQINPSPTSTFGQAVTFTGTVTAIGSVPTGTVTFYNGATALYTATLDAAGNAAVIIQPLATGVYSITAKYNASPNHMGSQSAPQEHTSLPTTANGLQVTEHPSPTGAGAVNNFRVTLRDAAGNIATTYRGTVVFQSDDPAATLPAPYAFTDTDAGTRIFTATFRTAGSRTITVTDGTRTGSQSGIIVVAAAASTITPTAGSGQSAPTGALFGTKLTAQVRDGFGNPVAGAVVTFTAPANGVASPSGTFVNGGSVYSTTTDVGGFATALDFRAGVVTGTYNVRAATPGVPGFINFTLTNTEGGCTPALVTNATDNGSGTECGTLSFSLVQAQSLPKPFTISFAPTLTAITVNGSLPAVAAGGVTVEAGCTDVAGRGVPRIQIIAGTGAGAIGLRLSGGATLNGLAIGGFSGAGIEVSGAGNRVTCSYIGTLDGNTAAANGVGIRLTTTASGTLLGSAGSATSGNLISGNTVGLEVAGGSLGNEMHYNWLGYAKNGTTALANTGGSLRLLPGGQLLFRPGNKIR
jgi:uncharacterized delta-60 repeat protein